MRPTPVDIHAGSRPFVKLLNPLQFQNNLRPRWRMTRLAVLGDSGPPGEANSAAEGCWASQHSNAAATESTCRLNVGAPTPTQPSCSQPLHIVGVNGGARRNRTDDLFNAIEALSQLSYGPEFSSCSCASHGDETAPFLRGGCISAIACARQGPIGGDAHAPAAGGLRGGARAAPTSSRLVAPAQPRIGRRG